MSRVDDEAGQYRPLIVHVIYRLDVGGLENGLVNIINRIPAERYRHVIISLTDISEFRQRISRRSRGPERPGGGPRWQVTGEPQNPRAGKR